MANDLNKVFLIGRLTRDPELKSTSSGSYFCKFSVASNRTIFKKEGESREEVGFFDCTAWGKLAEVISKYVHKGRRVGIDGSLRWSQWENQEGKKQSKVEIHVENFQFLDAKQAEGTMVETPSFQDAPVSNHEKSSPINDDDIPF